MEAITKTQNQSSSLSSFEESTASSSLPLLPKFIRDKPDCGDWLDDLSPTSSTGNSKSRDSSVSLPNDFERHSLLDTMGLLIKDAIPAISGHLTYAFSTLIYIYFVGHLNKPTLLAAVSLGTQFANVLCFAILIALDAGFTALASQAFGAGNHRKVGVYYQRNLLVYAMSSFPCMLVLLYSHSIFTAIGIEPEVAEIAAEFIKYMIPDYYVLIVLECTKNYLMAQNIFQIQYVLSFASAAFAWIYCLFFVTFLGLDIKGIAMARICTDISVTLILIAYIKISNPCPQSWIPWTSEALDDIFPYFKEIFVIGFPYYVEWQSWEANVLLIGLLHQTPVMAATGAIFPIIECIWSFAGGLASATSIYVGNAAGEGNQNKAKKYIKAGLYLNGIQIMFIVALLNLTRSQLARAITSDESVRMVLEHLLTIVSIIYISDANQLVLTSILRTIGKGKTVFLSALTFQTFIGITLGYVIGIYWTNSYVGIWIGQGIGAYLMCFFMAYNMFNLDWCNEIGKIRMRMQIIPPSGNGHGHYQAIELLPL